MVGETGASEGRRMISESKSFASGAELSDLPDKHQQLIQQMGMEQLYDELRQLGVLDSEVCRRLDEIAAGSFMVRYYDSSQGSYRINGDTAIHISGMFGALAAQTENIEAQTALINHARQSLDTQLEYTKRGMDVGDNYARRVYPIIKSLVVQNQHLVSESAILETAAEYAIAYAQLAKDPDGINGGPHRRNPLRQECQSISYSLWVCLLKQQREIPEDIQLLMAQHIDSSRLLLDLCLRQDVTDACRQVISQRQESLTQLAA